MNFKGQKRPYHKHFSGMYNTISSSPLVYKNNNLKLYLTKDNEQSWVVSAVWLKFNFLTLWELMQNIHSDTYLLFFSRLVLSKMEVYQMEYIVLAKLMGINAQKSVNGTNGAKDGGKWMALCEPHVPVWTISSII